jgi:hypothetical protein
MNAKQVVNKYVYLMFLEHLNTPEEAFKMVMEYAQKTQKNPWQCMELAFTSYTVVVRSMEDGDYIGYASAHVIPETKTLFFDHGYMRYPVAGGKKIFDMIALMMREKSGMGLCNIVLQSDLNPKLWCKHYGFKVSKEVVYTKEFENINYLK